MNTVEQAKYIIANNKYMTVASADASGKPWVATVFYGFDEAYNFYWSSSKDALHSANVRIRPEVGIVIFGEPEDGGRCDGVFLDCKATELEDPQEIDRAITALNTRRPKSRFKITSHQLVTGKAMWRLYRATPLEITKRADITKNGQDVTIRVPVQLAP